MAESSESASSSKNLASSPVEVDGSQPQNDTLENEPSPRSFGAQVTKCESVLENLDLLSSPVEADRSQLYNDTFKNKFDCHAFDWQLSEFESGSNNLASSPVTAEKSQPQIDTLENRSGRFPFDWQSTKCESSLKNLAISPVEADESELQNDIFENSPDLCSFDWQMIRCEKIAKYLASSSVEACQFQPQNDTFKNKPGPCSFDLRLTHNESSSINLAGSSVEAGGSQPQNDTLKSTTSLRSFDRQWINCKLSLKNLTNSSVEADVFQLQNDILQNGFDPCSFDWQSTKCEVKERLDYIFNNQRFCDVHFIVGSGSEVQKISAHRLILSIGSVVFQTNFSERWSDNNTEIEVTDVEPAVFKEFLKFLYFDQVTITSETVVRMWYVAHKYAVLALENKCIDFLFHQSCLDNIFNILDETKSFNEEALKNGCLEAIGSNTFDAVWAAGFCNLDVETLCLILKRSDLIISEIDLFEAVLRWSEAACKKENLPVKPQNQRAVLKNAVSLLRFPLMSPDVFASRVVDSGLLFDTEVLPMLLYFTKTSKPKVCFSEIPRRGLFVVNRYPNEFPAGIYGSAESRHSLGICSDCDIHLCGVALYGSPNEPVRYYVKVSLKSHIGSEVLSQNSGFYSCSEKIFRVMLKKPVSLTASTHYRLEVTVWGTYSVYGRDGPNHITVNLPLDKKVKFSFFNTDDSCSSRAHPGSKTFVSNGQIPKILFCL